MAENVLKKEFKEKDVQRLRNLVQGKYGEKTSTSIGYTKQQEVHEEGNVWEEDGRKWTIKNGIKQNVTKLDAAKKALQIPLTCPKCGGSMKHHLAQKMYKIHGFCFDPCTVEYEAELRKAGLYESYEKSMIQGSLKAFMKDIEQWVLESISQTNTFVTEQGDVEDWNSNNIEFKKKALENLQEFLTHVKKHIEE